MTSTFSARLSNVFAFAFACLILIYSASGPISEFVRWFIEFSTTGFDELSRREQRVLFKEHWLGSIYKTFERGFLLPTGLILGLPVLLSFCIAFTELGAKSSRQWIYLVLGAVSALAISAWIINLFAIDGGLIPSLNTRDYIIFPIAVALTLYLTWRFFGTFIVGFCLFWIIYFFVRGSIPEWMGIFAGSDASYAQSLRSMTLNFWAQTGGMFGQPLQVVSGNVLIFIVFGAVLMASGAGALLMKIANRITGGLTGGAAHAAVASSALFGTLSGAAISNVVSTGTMTIPIIKKSGFKPAFAGAVEAAASTGGQVMPPVMGVVAFFVAGQIGLEYRYIVIAAILPAIFYYLGVFLTVYFQARKNNIGALPLAERPGLTGWEKVQCLVFVIPLTVLTYFLFTQPSVPKAGFYGFIAAVTAALIFFKEFRSWSKFWTAMAEAGRMSANIIVIVAAIGLIVGLIQVSGFSGRMSQLLAEISGGPLFSVLVIVALGSIVLGMGLPPGATYFVIVIALSSGIETVGIPNLSLHLFVVFFAVMSTVTPPVALAAFAAAPIAGADPVRTGFEAARLAFAGFLIPFVFVYHPAVLYKLQVVFEWFGEDRVQSSAMLDISTVTWADFGWIIFAFVFAMWLISSAVIGFERKTLNIIERVLRLASGLAVLVPNILIAGVALAVGICLVLWHRFTTKENSTGELQNA